MGKPNKEKKIREQKRLAERKDPELRTLKEREKRKKETKIFLLFLAKAILPVALAISVFGVIYAKFLPVLPQTAAFCVIGFVGAALLGVGISLFLYGKNAAKIFASVGILLTALSCLLMSTQGLVGEYSAIFYYCNISFAFVSLFFYFFFFRSAVESWLRGRRISDTMIKKSKKGAKNYWWYEELHKNFGLSSVYTLNKVFTVFFAAHFTASVLLGWAEPLFRIFAISFTLLALLTSHMAEFARMQNTMEEYGCKFVLFRKNKYRGNFDSSILDMMVSFVPILSAVCLWIIINNM